MYKNVGEKTTYLYYVCECVHAEKESSTQHTINPLKIRANGTIQCERTQRTQMYVYKNLRL